MKYSEFENKLKDIDSNLSFKRKYSADPYSYSSLYGDVMYNDIHIGLIALTTRYSFDLYDAFYPGNSDKLYDLMAKLAKTPVDQREDELADDPKVKPSNRFGIPVINTKDQLISFINGMFAAINNYQPGIIPEVCATINSTLDIDSVKSAVDGFNQIYPGTLTFKSDSHNIIWITYQIK